MTLSDAVEMLEKGDWQGAHSIAQKDESALGSWAHGIVHIMEGDLSNAGHWYERAGRALADPERIAEEISSLKEALTERANERPDR